ncbi:TPA: phage holin family protein [Candidatus Saccharibacteria bacterium]|nr:phage holin family protein [Candidatus Saccharibacteria bacterium]HIO87654.1 phage holin family protein [Candidatus Saccharibacteria bacterium]
MENKTVTFSKGSAPKLVVRLGFNALGLWIAARLSENIDYQNSLVVIAVAALIFTAVNAVIRPVLVLLTLPAVILSLGFFMLIINGFMVYLTSALYDSFEVKTFGAAIMTAIIVWIVNYGLSMFFASSKLEVK